MIRCGLRQTYDDLIHLHIVNMKRKDITIEDIEFNKWNYNHELKVLPLPDNCIWIEDPMWYDGICMYQAPDGTKYSKLAHIPIDDDEMCKRWKIYKVELARHSDEPFDYEYRILSERPDNAK